MVELDRGGVIVVAAGHQEELLRLAAGGEQPARVVEGDEAVAVAVGDEDGPGTLRDAGQVVELVADQPACREKRRESRLAKKILRTLHHLEAPTLQLQWLNFQTLNAHSAGNLDRKHFPK